tara:strand:- start:276 stop:476 length:201 start_codon:yes stop_codon:yes gene_type:complete
MSNSNKTLQIKLTQDQVRQIITNALFTNEELKNAFLDKKVSIKDEWHVFKWQDPESFVTVTLTEIE